MGTGDCQNTGVTSSCLPDGGAVCSVSPKNPGAEVCDGRDNNCNGVVDDVARCLYTIAGSRPMGWADGAAQNVRFAKIRQMSFGPNGKLYVADEYTHTIRVIDDGGTSTTLVGNSTCGAVDGLVTAAVICRPYGVTVTPDGGVYFTQAGNSIRRVVGNQVQTVASGFVDLKGMTSLPNGDVLVADYGGHRIIRVSAAGATTTEVGNGTSTSVDGARDSGLLTVARPVAVMAAADGTLYVTEATTSKIRAIPLSGSSFTVAGGTPNGFADGPPLSSRFKNPRGVAIDSVRPALYIADHDNERMRYVPLDGGLVTTIVGVSGRGFINGSPALSRAHGPSWVAMSGDRVYFADDSQSIRVLDVGTATLSDFCGLPVSQANLDGPASAATMRDIFGLGFGPDGSLYIMQEIDSAMRKLTPSGQVQTVFAPSPNGTWQDGTLAIAKLDTPRSLTFAPNGVMYVADVWNHVIRRVDLTAQSATSPYGTANVPGFANGAGNSALFSQPSSVAYLSKGAAGTLLVADVGNALLRSVDLATGITSTFAGTSGMTAPVLDGPPNTGTFSALSSVAVASDGGIFVLDNRMVRRVDANGSISTPGGISNQFADVPVAMTIFQDTLYIITPLQLFTGPASSAFAPVAQTPPMSLGINDGDTNSSGTGVLDWDGIAVDSNAVYIGDRFHVRRWWRP